MKAVRFHEFGGPEVLRWEEAPERRPVPGEVLVRLKAAALNHLDLWVTSGMRERKIPLPHIPGSDGAGIVEESAAEGFSSGDRVLISPGLSCGRCERCLAGDDNLCSSYRVLGTRDDGTYAGYVTLPAANLLPIPDGLDFPEAAAIPLVFLTAWHMLSSLARVKPFETVLVHGAGSGVGSAGIQIAKLLGARVITTAGSDEKLARAKALGADETINYREANFADAVREMTHKAGVDVVFEHVGGKVFEESVRLLTKGGRLVTCGATGEFTANVDLRYVFARHTALYGSWMGRKSELIGVLRYFAGGRERRKLHPVIDTVMPLAEAANAQRRMIERRNCGKIVLTA